MHNPLVSIIVPVHNAASYLSQCLDSLLAQSYQNIEVIAINDGSQDDSWGVMQAYKKDKRFHCLTQMNQGVSATRNRAIGLAKGEYMMFVDADDWISLETVQVCINNIGANSMVRFMMQYANDEALLDIYPCFYNGKNITITARKLFEDIISYKVGGHCVYYLYRTNIIKDNKIKFLIDIKYCEDLCFVLEVLKKADTIKIIPNVFYKYYTNFQSATRDDESKIRNLQSLPKLREKVFDIFPTKYRDEYKKLYNQTLLSLLLDYYSSFSTLSYKNFKENVKKINTVIKPMINEIGKDNFNIKWRIFIKLNLLNYIYLLYLYMKIYQKKFK